MRLAATPRFKKILASFNDLFIGTKLAPPGEDFHVDQGNYDDEIKDFLRGDSPPPPAKPAVEVVEESINNMTPVPPPVDLDKIPPPPHPSHRASASIVLQESETIKTSSLTVSVSTLPSQVQAEVDDNVPVPPAKKGRPVTKTKGNVPISDTTDVTPGGRRSSTRQVALPEQDLRQTSRTSGRKRTKN